MPGSTTRPRPIAGSGSTSPGAGTSASSASFADLTQDELDEFITDINNRPRKILAWRTPAEVFHELSANPATPLHVDLELGIPPGSDCFVTARCRTSLHRVKTAGS